MIQEQRQALDDMIVKIRSGRLTRRGFMQRAAVVGLSASAAVSLLEACGGNTNNTGGNGPSTNIIWQSEADSTNTYKDIADSFNAGIGKQKGIHVTWQQGPAKTDDMLQKYNNMFRARSSSIDVIALDIVYPAQFAEQQWTVPIDENRWSSTERQKYLQGPLKGCTYNGKLWAAPFRTDLGLLYYRKDLMPAPPETYEDLKKTAQGISPSKVKYGYVWQGSQYEGLVCNFSEVLYGFGGSILDSTDATKVTVNSPEAVQALTEMVSWVGTISPAAVTTYAEDASLATWEQGNAAFMRNWPYAYVKSNTPAESKVPSKFDITALPHGGNGTVGHSSIGGWNFAINAFSKQQDAAWEFIKYSVSPEAQKKGALSASWTTTLQSIYDDPDVLSKNPLFGKLKPILQNALPRPVTPKYLDVSDAIQRNIYNALKKNATPADALKQLESDLQKVVTTK